MNNVIKGVITVSVLFFAMLLAWGLVATAPEPEQIEPEDLATSVRVLEVNREKVQLEVVSQGSVVPRNQTELVPEVSGRVQWVSPNLVPGGYFSKDDILLRIDDRDYQATVARSEAALKRAKAEEELARFELARMEELVKNKLTSQSSLETVLRNHRIAEAALADAKIALEQANRDLNRTQIRAPYEGLVRSERVDLGQYVSQGQSIASVYASDSAEIRLPLADRQLAYLDLPLGYRGELSEEDTSEVIISTEYGGRVYDWIGRLVRTEAEIDAKSRMVTAVVRVESVDNLGKPNLPIGLFVSARIKGRWVEDVVTLPRAALRNENQVLVVDSDNRIHFRNIDIMRYENDKVLVSGGLQSGEVVNVSPIQTVVEGMRIKPVMQSTNG